ncbi:NAD(P)/FAD-dependent oxidoreductase [Microbacterium rhizophilus]|uniref:NAD(P)/FAD-dependent oxidoreductase n=1 Tax=Microbacterium rhizophilus TaxID=3138934 RepID=UPI0031E9A600
MSGAPRRVVVVGNGIAGLTACDTLRAEGFDGELTVVGAEVHAPYSRPALSKALLKLDGDLGAHELPPSSHDAIELRGVSATGLDVDARRIALSDGQDLAYDGLVIASGARARRPEVDVPVLTLRELDDAIALRGALAGRPEVVVLGGGVLGMEIASGALAAGCRVTLVATSAPMSRQLGGFLATMLARAATERGLRVVTTPSAEIVERGGRAAVSLADGTVIEADVVAGATGDHANIEWLAGSRVLTGDALVADGRGRVADGVVAAGDVASWRGSRGVRRTPLWTSAIEQARTAAAALLRGDEVPELDFQSYFWTEQFDLAVKAVGDLPLIDDPETVEGDAASDSALLRWTHPDGSHTAVAVNWRIPIPKLRRLTLAG